LWAASVNKCGGFDKISKTDPFGLKCSS